MKSIKLLDCTLRDGGYINDWNFGKEAIKNIGNNIILSGIEFFEIGFLKDQEYDENIAIFDGNQNIKKMIQPKKKNTDYVAMIDMGQKISLNKLGKRDENSIDSIRVIFKKSKIDEAYDYCKNIIELGYKVFIQPVGTDLYTDKEYIDLIYKFNELNPFAFYIVDTFGLIKKRDFTRFVMLANNNLKPNIALGYHSHNNLQHAFSNAVAMTELNMDRDIIIDASVFGMGRGAGNLNLELFAEYMNEYFNKSYRIEPMLEIIDEYLNDIYQRHFWGYSLHFYLSAKNYCHPNYASYFSEKGTLTVKAFNELLKSIPLKERQSYSKVKAEEYYFNYQQNYIDDKNTISILKEKLKDKNILVLGPGKSLNLDLDIIKNKIKEKNLITIGLNFIPEKLDIEYVFCCHLRRYAKIESNKTVKKIITSNIRDVKSYDYMLNFSSFACEEPEIVDNSGIMCLNLLLTLGVNQVYIAGLDGYDILSKVNYSDAGLEYDFSVEMIKKRNILIEKELKKISKKIKLEFLTPTIYSI